MMAKTTSFFVLFAIVAGIGAMAPAAFGDHSEVTITASVDSWNPSSCGGDTGVECYTPSSAIVDVGGKVIMDNADAANPSGQHTFTSGVLADDGIDGNGEFHSGTLGGAIAPDKTSYEWVPEKAGEYPYFCQFHAWMTGVITVQEEAADEEEIEEMESMENPDESEIPDPDDEIGDIGALKEDENMETDEGEMMKDEEMMEGEMGMDGKMMDDGGLMVNIEVDTENANIGDMIPIDVEITMMDAEGNEEGVNPR
ncbi:MAG: hypothetical protein D9C04_01385 [Nitrosopumilus sp. B06]|nr:MAG: hypothetical protein D9C04_01385 [Nitrosopumilus sp. B06]